MRNIRIGNDIRLKVELKQTDGFDNILPLNNSNIKQVRCYLINTSFSKEPTDEDKKKFRRVGFPDFYRPTAHNINNAGFPSYHMQPANACNYDRFLPDFHDFHWWPGFRGFGLHPEHFHDTCGHMWGMGPKPIMEVPEHPWYLADSQVLSTANTISCMFPAFDQKLCGTYKLVVVLTVYEKGWGRHNLRTFTLDKGDIFKLVDGNDPTEGAESGPITISVDDKGNKDTEVKSVYTENTNQFYLNSESTLSIGDKDLNQNIYQIIAKLQDGSTLLYNPEHWPFSNLIFTSDNPDVVDVDEDGTLYAKKILWSYRDKALHYNKKVDPWYKNETIKYCQDGDPHMHVEEMMHANEDTHYEDETMVICPDEGTKRQWPEATIYVTPYGMEDAVYSFKVTVVEMDTVKIGFDEEDDIDYIDPYDEFFNDYNAKAISYVVPNNLIDGGYMWIFSQRKIHYVKGMVMEDESNSCCEDDNKCKCNKNRRKPYDLFKKEQKEDITSDVSSGFRIPLVSYDQTVDGYYCYRSAAPIRDGNVKMKIKFE